MWAAMTNCPRKFHRFLPVRLWFWYTAFEFSRSLAGVCPLLSEAQKSLENVRGTLIFKEIQIVRRKARKRRLLVIYIFINIIKCDHMRGRPYHAFLSFRLPQNGKYGTFVQRELEVRRPLEQPNVFFR
jgi:hypothetical protein